MDSRETALIDEPAPTPAVAPTPAPPTAPPPAARPAPAPPAGGRTRRNVGSDERVASLAAGAVLALAGLRRGGWGGMLAGLAAGMLIQRAVTGRCPVSSAFGLDSATTGSDGRSAEQTVAARGIHVEQALLINRPRLELYDFWRDLANLPQFMRHLQRVEVLDATRSRWVAAAPALAGGEVAWEAEITRDEPGERIAWRSLPGSEIATVGEISFASAPGDRGTEVHVTLDYVPPAGRLGHWLATMTGHGPRRQMHADLRRFKQLMEVGEIPSIDGQPRGGCGGRSRRDQD